MQDLKDSLTLYYTEELQILGKYMFITCDEYDDIASGYSDITYFVYTADQPMDDHDLFEEYYIAMVYDNSGEAHLASLSNRDWDFSEQVAGATPETPVTVSAYIKVAANYDHKVLISRDKDVNMIRETALNAYASEHGILYKNIDIIYEESY